MKTYPLLIRHSLLTAFTLVGATLFTETTVFAQSGGCQRGGMGGSPGMNPSVISTMAAMNGFNPRGFGATPDSMPGYQPGYMAGYQAAMAQANQPPGKSPAETRQILQATYQAKADKLRDKKAANREANLARQKSKNAKPSSSSSPTACRSSGRYGYWIV